MKDYEVAFNNYLDSLTGEFNRSELIEKWNEMISAYEADEDVIQALADYTTARTAFANAFKNCIIMQSEIDGLGFKCQRFNDWAIPDVNNNFHSATQFDDAEGMRKTKRNETTFYLLRRAFENDIADCSCPALDPCNI